jgi:hypothetical protein
LAKQQIKLNGYKELTQRLSAFEKADLPFTLAKALNATATYLKVQEQEYIASTFNKTVPFTVTAPMTSKWANKKDLRVNFFLKDEAVKGNAPEQYLAPQVYGGSVFVTRFTRRLRRQFPSHVGPNQYVLHWADNENAPKGPGGLTKVLAGLNALDVGPVWRGSSYAKSVNKSKRTSAGSYFFLPIGGSNGGGGRADTKRGRGKTGDSGYKGPGIYTREGDQLVRVFRILNAPPTVPQKYDWSAERLTPIAEKQFASQVLVALKF